MKSSQFVEVFILEGILVLVRFYKFLFKKFYLLFYFSSRTIWKNKFIETSWTILPNNLTNVILENLYKQVDFNRNSQNLIQTLWNFVFLHNGAATFLIALILQYSNLTLATPLIASCRPVVVASLGIALWCFAWFCCELLFLVMMMMVGFV